MGSSYEIVRSAVLTTSSWSGGKTTQLAIYPKEALYAERNFMWRISTATVEVQKSEFTKLPNIYRHIMVLEGGMILQHTGRYSKQLKQFDQDSFWGDWETNSEGQVTDFNLMLSSNCKGCIDALKLQSNQLTKLQPVMTAQEEQDSLRWETIYALAPISIILDNEQPLLLNKGDVLIVSYENDNQYKVELLNTKKEDAYIVRAGIIYAATFGA